MRATANAEALYNARLCEFHFVKFASRERAPRTEGMPAEARPQAQASQKFHAFCSQHGQKCEPCEQMLASQALRRACLYERSEANSNSIAAPRERRSRPGKKKRSPRTRKALFDLTGFGLRRNHACFRTSKKSQSALPSRKHR